MSTTVMGGDDTSPAPRAEGVPPEAQAKNNGQAERSSRAPLLLTALTNRPWREQALTRCAELTTLLEWYRANPNGAPRTLTSRLDKAIEGHLQKATEAAKELSRWRPVRNVTTMERVNSNLDAAEVGLLRRAPKEYLGGQISHILAHVQFHLRKNDPRRTRVEKLADAAEKGTLNECDKEAIIQAVWVASLEARREVARVQTFCAVLYATAVVLTIAAAGLAVWGWIEPTHVTLCFEPPGDDVCPAGSAPSRVDIVLVQFIGLLSGAVSGATGLRHLNGRSTRLGLPVALSILKLPMGALTAVLGLLLMRGEFIPGLSNLDTTAQILAWAVVFGAAQQLVTGFVDRKASDVLGQVAGQKNKEIQ
ncbi:hypothetical protein ACFYE2_03760 [Kocuria sp. CPCC 205300]|uniref:hypothetical protein n=1 Tax=Kocuria sabuli TaxID=3071448 RepID=UPI0036D76251